jgi:hypothetical protein
MIALMSLMPYTDAVVAPSPNHGPRKAPAIEGIVLHATADEGHEAGTLAWLRSTKSQVSCHLLVGRTGLVTRFVGDHQRAWHVGTAWWRGTHDVNSITLGIEIANRNDGEPYTDAQYDKVAEIVAHYCRQGLSVSDVVGHADIAEDRRTDPFGWDWARFRSIVMEELRGSRFEVQWNSYDRRSGERTAVDEKDVPSIATTPTRARTIEAPQQPLALPAPKPQIAITASSQQDPTIPPPKAKPLPKPVFCSRTLWLNGLTVLAAGGALIGDTLDLAFSVGLYLPKEVTTWALFGVGMVNILLRFQTRCPISGGHHKEGDVAWPAGSRN